MFYSCFSIPVLLSSNYIASGMGRISFNKYGIECKEQENCLELIAGLYQNLKKGQDQYTGRIAVELNHLL
jgi:hypothetical protein